jgi:glc operon protein GlcG
MICLLSLRRWVAPLVVIAAAAAGRADPLPTKPVLTLAVAREIAAAAEAHARENQWNVCIAIVDDGGHLLYFLRMDGTQTGSVTVSQEKARTACAFRRPTKTFEEGVAGGRTVILSLPGALPIEGGLPLVVEGTVVGAIGVSGVTSQQDGMIAQAGVDALARGLLAPQEAPQP